MRNSFVGPLCRWEADRRIPLSSFRFGVAVQDFGKSWTSGLAFLAVIKSIDTSLVDMRKALLRTPRENLEEAFRTAHYSLGIPRLLEPEGSKTIWTLLQSHVCPHVHVLGKKHL